MVDGVKFYGTATIGTKGQIVIPTEARKDLNLKEGDKIIVVTSPQGSGLGLIKAQALEGIIEKMQTQQNAFLKTAKDIKDMADQDSKKEQTNG
jgi:AbrB family looped-hinge helix DNA binding protein